VLSLKPGLTLYFARHGETEANVERRFQGHARDTPLTVKGLAQAHALGEILRARASSPLVHVSSPLSRARLTMEIVRQNLGLPLHDYRVDPRLIEIDLGAWDGLTAEEAQARFPEAHAARSADKWKVNVPGGGENYASVARRAEGFVHDLDEDTFAISHGAFTRILRGLFLGLTWQEMSDLDEPQGCVFRVRGNAVDRLDLAQSSPS
jgi:probable phosphoglycerate mutase